jgi:transcriptional regulator with XRE-family HTH domain
MASPRLSDDNKRAMGERLQAARWVAGLSGRSVAATLGVSPPAVAQWERGTLPGADHRAALAKLYDVDEAVLFAEYEAHLDAARALLRPA